MYELDFYFWAHTHDYWQCFVFFFSVYDCRYAPTLFTVATNGIGEHDLGKYCPSEYAISKYYLGLHSARMWVSTELSELSPVDEIFATDSYFRICYTILVETDTMLDYDISENSAYKCAFVECENDAGEPFFALAEEDYSA